MNNPPSGTVTFLFTDIEGSTRLSQEYPETIHSAIEKHHLILYEAIESNNGFVFDNIGDAFYCAFESPEDAVSAAVIIQKNLANYKWDDVVIKTRIGIHSGAAEWNGENYMGYITLARTARVMSATYGEQIIISNDTYELLKNNIFSEISFRDLGERRLKDLIQPIRLYQIVAEGIREEFPQLKTLDARPNNLPVQLSSFIGREEEMRQIKSILKEKRLLTLTGPGGTGKTRLSLQIAAEIIDYFGNGVWFVELASLIEPELLPNAIMQAIGIKEQPKQKTEDTLTDYLQDKEILIILDNCEHIIKACAILSEKILKNSPKLKIIATSREALVCYGEQIHKTLSLETPDPKEKESPEQLTQYEAVRLFIERALSVNKNFRVNNENAPALADICHKLDGIPLAIELAAVRLKILSIEKINERLDDRFKLLTGGKRTALPRQQTLKALIDWSYDLLSEKEKTLWSRLSVFSGGWNLDAAEEICSDISIIQKEEILDQLSNLTDKSIVIFNQDNNRYTMLETIKQYGHEKLLMSDEYKNIMSRFLNYQIELAETASKNFRGSNAAFWIKVLNNEYKNLEKGLIWSLENNENETGARLVGAIAQYLFIIGKISEAMLWLEIVLKKQPESMDFYFCRVNYFIGKFARLNGDFEKAKNFLNRSLKYWREVGEKQGITDTLNSLGVNEFDQGRYEQAAEYYEENLEIYRESENKNGIAITLNNIGNVVSKLGDFIKANKLFEECLEIRRELKDKLGIGITLNNLGVLAFEQGEYEKATDLLNESLRIRHEIGDRNGISISFLNLGHTAYNQGDYLKASNFYEESLKICIEMGDKSLIADSLCNLGKSRLEKEETEQALKLIKDSLAVNREIRSLSQTACCLYYLGRIAFLKNEYEKAREYYHESLNIYYETGNKKDIALNILRLAEFHCFAGQNIQALKMLGFIKEKYFESNKIIFPKVDQIFFDNLIVELKKKLSEKEFLKSYEAGKLMLFEQAIEIAISK
ncbi:MAG TPA: tetratricopeptide repeat protein [Ignavibacteria bacterium]|nr:tetratricopeptide repeat protein [Ignavibacteria bacterium]